jgi:hypothetical protein
MMASGTAAGLDVQGDDHIIPVSWEGWLTLPVREDDIDAVASTRSCPPSRRYPAHSIRCAEGSCRSGSLPTGIEQGSARLGFGGLWDTTLRGGSQLFRMHSKE